jgi:DtxR family Mn-dependent transcriptional regulator
MLSKSIEDYLETIYHILQEKKFARSTDIALKLNVKQPSATEMVQKLAKENLVKYEKYRGITLTEKGRKLARDIDTRHKILVSFLKLIGIDDLTAEQDACRIEHDVTPKTMQHLVEFISRVKTDQKHATKRQ